MTIRVPIVLQLVSMLAGWSIATAQVDTVTIIHINDSHTDLVAYAGGHLGGAARAASIIGEWKATEPNPILIHGGDFTVGTLMFNSYFGVPDLQIMNSLGFDALALGNHEFDAGPEQLALILKGATPDTSFHFLSTNALNLSSVPALDSIVRHSAVITRGTLKIGIVALTTPAANIESSPGTVFIDTNVVQDAMAEVLSLRGAGCGIVLLVSHLGLTLDQQIAPFLTGVDAIIGGHSHDALQSPVIVNGIPIVQAGASYHYVGRLRLLFTGSSTQVLDYTLREITDAIPAEPTVEGIIDQLKVGVAQQYGALLGDPYAAFGSVPSRIPYLPTSITHPKSPLGDTLTTAMLFADSVAGYHPQCAIEATGHMAEDLYSGVVTPADVFRVYPYGYDASDGLGFRLASFELSGAEISGILQGLLAYIHPESNDYQYVIQSTGLDYSIDTTGGTLTIANLTIAGAPIHPDSMYRIIGSDRLMGYLPTLFSITPGNPRVYGVAVTKVLLERLKGSVSLVRQRIIPRVFKLGQNYPNPFNPSTTIPFSIAQAGFVNLKIFNLLGQEIATLVNGPLPPGEHLARWDALGVSSGCFLCRLQMGDATATRKLLLLR